MTTRRQFLVGTTGLVGAGALGRADHGTPSRILGRSNTAMNSTAIAAPELSGIDHIVVVCMENRSFDHLLGWLPGSDGRQDGLSYPDPGGARHPTFHLTTYQGCGHPDPDHSYAGGRVEYDNGACDGWLRVNDDFSIGYYQRADLPFLGNAAPTWTVCDNYFAATLAPTIPNRLYLHAAQTDRIDGSLGLTSIPTIWDRLVAAGVPSRYYFTDVPILALWGLRYAGISSLLPQFLADAALGALPAVSYVDRRSRGFGASGCRRCWSPRWPLGVRWRTDCTTTRRS
jgi:phospholipase C